MRVLVIQLKRIGDAILTTPLIAALREHIPGCEITLALDASTATLAPALRADHVLIFQRGWSGLGFWKNLFRGRFDVCLDVTGNDRSAMVTALSRASRRITWQRFAKKPFRPAIYTDFVESSVKERHTADHHADLLRALDVTVQDVPLHLSLPAGSRSEADQALAAIGISGPFAVVHAGTARPEKYWLPERWAEVIDTIRSELRIPVVLTGSSDATEQKHLAAIRAALPGSAIPDLSGKLSLLGTAAVLERARFLCAVDSAPVHLADALGTPLVALFGPTNPFHWRPRRATSHLVTAAGDGTLRPGYPKAPMEDIPAEKVTASVRQLI